MDTPWALDEAITRIDGRISDLARKISGGKGYELTLPRAAELRDLTAARRNLSEARVADHRVAE